MTGSRAGRPRDSSLDERAIAATLELLVERGFEGTTVQAVAKRSGVHASALYRRWSSRIELIEEAIFPGFDPPAVEPTGDLRADLLRFLGAYLAAFGSPAALAGGARTHRASPVRRATDVRRSSTSGSRPGRSSGTSCTRRRPAPSTRTSTPTTSSTSCSARSSPAPSSRPIAARAHRSSAPSTCCSACFDPPRRHLESRVGYPYRRVRDARDHGRSAPRGCLPPGGPAFSRRTRPRHQPEPC